ncbi:MAG: pirin family protein [Deltaproteobacteria bacterium]|nr:pirin family protein [Deltaproteobacteria bacterium]
MSKVRKISKVWKSKPTIEGAGVHLKRGFGFHEVPQFDPFLLLDDFHSDNPAHYLKGFPWHPHRGIETITYVLHGKVEHGDSMGNQGTISSGDVQWMTAGSGIIHQEMPKGDKGGLMWGFQLWANLPKSQKMMNPSYRDVTASQIPEVTLETGVKIKIICGMVNGVYGPVKDIVIDPEYLDVYMFPKTTFTHSVKSGHTQFAYVIEGRGYFDEGRNSFGHEVIGENYFDFKRTCLVDAENLILYGREGNQVVVTSEDVPVRFLLISGKPIGEPVAWYGPIVMNTQEELRLAFEEYEKGTFIKHRGTP